MRPIMRQAEQYPDRTASVREAMPAPEGHFDDAFKNRLMEVINHPETGGGFTLRDFSGDSEGDEYLVGLPRSEGHEEKIPAGEMNADSNVDYLDRKWHKIHEHEDNRGGGWMSRPDWYNDVSRRYPDLNAAGRAAFEGDQEALWDNIRKREWDTEEAGWATGAPWRVGGVI